MMEKTDKQEIRRLRKLLVQHRDCLRLMMAEGKNYTDGLECPFCSGYEGPEASTYNREDVKHARQCPTRVAKRLLAREI